MTLTGPSTLAVAIVLCIVMPVVTSLVWNRVGRGPSWAARCGRWATRGVLMLVSQATAVVLAAVLVNDAGSFYSSWREVFGEQHTVKQSAAATGSQDAKVRGALARARAHGHGVVIHTTIPGVRSGIGTLPALVYLPAEYGMPAYAHRSFPVVELVAGTPGTPKTWTDSLQVAHVLDREIAAGRSLPFIAVIPSREVNAWRDTECVNVVGGPSMETYLTVDVRTAITRDYRASRSWAIMGYSSGAFCATNLAMRNPNLFDAAVSISGFAAPWNGHGGGDLFGHDTALRDLNTPVWRETHMAPPNIALLVMASAQDRSSYHDAAALEAAARAPMRLTVVSLRHGGHNFAVWRAEEPIAFAWISVHLTAPLAPPPVIDNTTPISVTN